MSLWEGSGVVSGLAPAAAWVVHACGVLCLSGATVIIFMRRNVVHGASQGLRMNMNGMDGHGCMGLAQLAMLFPCSCVFMAQARAWA